MRKKKILSLALALLMCLSVIQPAAFVLSALAVSENAYATIISASDFQGDSPFTNFAAMLAQIKSAGYPTPAGALFGGDYTNNSEDPTAAAQTILSAITDQYPDMNTANAVFVQGNHDLVGSALTDTGFHDYGNYVVYSINEDSFKTGQSGRAGYAAVVQTLAADIKQNLDDMIRTGDRRPVFVITHVPLHHSSRSSYGDNLYSKYIFDVLNEAGSTLDIMFMFGHNHSSAYDDYIGGSVNFLPVGDTIRIPIPDTASVGAAGYTEETLNFTYMNCGYVGYSSNSTTGGSTNTLTMSAIELCTDTVEIARYTTTGLYTSFTVPLKNIHSTEPLVKIYGSETGTIGCGEVLYSRYSGIENPVYSWSCDNSAAVELLPAGANAQLIYKAAGTANITLTATGSDGTVLTDTLTVTVIAGTLETYYETVIIEPEKTVEEQVAATYYVLTSAPTAGKNYIISNVNAAGDAYAMSNTLSNKKLAGSAVSVNAGNTASSGQPYIKTDDTALIWAAESGKTTGSFAFSNSGKYINAKDDKTISFKNVIADKSSWTYSSSILSNADNSARQIQFSGSAFAVAKNSGTAVYFYEETPVTETVTTVIPAVTEQVEKTRVVPPEYAPASSLSYNGKNADGRTLKFYDAVYGNTVMLDGEFSGFADSAVTLNWNSTNPAVASVENGMLTFNGSGETTVYFTVTDGVTTLEKSVNIFVSRASKPVDTFVLTTTLEAGKDYVIASGSTVGSTTYAATNTTVGGGTPYNTRLSPYSITLADINGTVGFLSDSDNIVWTAVAGDNGEIYLQNAANGSYLNAAESSGVYDITLSSALTAASAAVSYTGGVFRIGGLCIRYSGDVNFRTGDDSSSNIYLYERIPSEPMTELKVNGVSVAGTTRTIYSVSSSASENLSGSYMNFGEEVSVSWISSDPSIASVDENGYITFTGAEGTVDITYSVSDTESHSSSKTVTYVTTESAKPVRFFKPATAIEAGKTYVVSTSLSQGSTYIMNNTAQSRGTRLSKDYAVIQIDTADSLPYIELPESALSDMWTASASSSAGYFNFRNNSDNSYLWAQLSNNAVGTSADTSAASSVSCYNFTLYNAAGSLGLVTESSGYDGFGVSYSASGANFRGTYAGGETSDVYLFEEVVPVPALHIRQNFENIEGTTQERLEICPYQTEKLEPVPVNFSTKNVSYTWSSSDETIATVDENGLVTYTGKYGEVTISVSCTANTPDSDGTYDTASASVTLNAIDPAANGMWRYTITDSFIPGEYYAFSGNNSPANLEYVMNCWPNNDNTEMRLYENTAQFISGTNGVYFETDDLSVAWECIASSTTGAYYFKSAQTGKYLCLYAASASAADRRVTVTDTTTEISENCCLISYDNLLYRVSSAQSASVSNYLSYNSRHEYRLSSAPKNMYIYQRSAPAALAPEIEIRQSAWNGAQNVTNKLQSRSEVYDGMTERFLAYTEGFATVDSISWSSDNNNVGVVDNEGLLTYTGQTGLVTLTLTVTGTDSAGNAVTKQVITTVSASPLPYTSPTEDYPEYPNDGSVRINKTASGTAAGYSFQTSGVTEVELAVTGVPMTQPVDVVIVFDHSSSMNDSNRLTKAIANTREFAIQLVNKNPKNRLALVTFDRYFNIYRSVTSTTPDHSTYDSSTENRIVTGDGTAAGAFMTAENAETLVSQIDSLSYNNTPGTNYDDGLERCYEILAAAKNDPDANKNQYVIFMSDGEPYVYNRLLIDYANAATVAWLNGDETNSSLAPILADPATYPVAQYFNTDGKHWIAEAIKAPEGTDAGLPTVSYYDNYRTGLGATLFSIGYSISASSARATQVLKNIASSDNEFFYAQSNLQEAYDRILDTILYAANEAVVTDVMGEDYDLQFAQSFELGNGMSTITLSPAPYIEIGSWSLNSDGTRNEYTVKEKITFETNTNGYLTAAYSDLLSGNIYDAAANKISGKYVSYNLETETFEWTIGDITRDEVTLKYYAYLTGSAEGDRPAGVYDTNEQAVLTYNNYLDNPCEQIFPVPALGWQEAAVNYEFYFVNEAGQPVNSAGVIVPFSERVLVGNVQTQTMYLNTTDEFNAFSLIAADNIPEGYQLYNPSAAYNIWVSSGDNASRAEIADSGCEVITTYFYEGSMLYNGNGTVPGVTDYTNTHVAFAVVLKTGIVPDSIVIDYGLPVKIHPLSNDIAVSGTVTAITDALPAGTELNSVAYESSQLISQSLSLVLKYGSAQLSENVITYTPASMEMSAADVLYYECLSAAGAYFYTSVTVIPAANIYYEESFFTFTDPDSADAYSWTDAGATYADKFQAEDRPGTFNSKNDANNAYGRDDAYADSVSTYSLGSAKKAYVDKGALGREPKAEFTFCGTGFDLFSVTAGNTGAVKVEVYNSSGTRIKNYTVQTYYGYSYDEATDTFTPNLESTEALYQVPVIRSRNLGYGTYRVVITPKYARAFDMHYNAETGEGGYEIYVDSVRIYDPAGNTPDISSDTGKAYLEDNEYSPEYIELRSNMLTAQTFYDSTKELDSTQFAKGVVFIDGIASLTDEGLVSDKFLTAGPNNELYLAKGQAIAFHVSSSSGIQPKTLQLGMKVIKGGSATLLCMNSGFEKPNSVTVSGSHEMYRGLTSYITWNQDALAQGVYKTKYPIIIMNNSDSIVSLTSFKWTWDSADTAAAPLSFAVTSSTPMLARAAIDTFVLSNGTETQKIAFNPDSAAVEWSDTTLTVGDTAEVRITTPVEIVAVSVGGMAVQNCEIDENGQKVWTLSFTVKEEGENSYTLEFFDSSGEKYTAAVPQTVIAEAAPEDGVFTGIIKIVEKFVEFFKSLLRWWKSLW